jgi:hypothetical protein
MNVIFPNIIFTAKNENKTKVTLASDCELNARVFNISSHERKLFTIKNVNNNTIIIVPSATYEVVT